MTNAVYACQVLDKCTRPILQAKRLQKFLEFVPTDRRETFSFFRRNVFDSVAKLEMGP
jgi:hypothetical protein